jgi:uncharacterized protein YcaQ
MKSILLSNIQARHIILHAAGLARKAQFGMGIDAVDAIVNHLGFIQLDTIYVVERAHHQVLATRIPDYETEWLTTLCEEGRIFEYFSAEAGYFPMSDFRYSLPVKECYASKRKAMTAAQTRLMKEALERVEREGPLTVGDFDYDRLEASTGWWDWRPAKVALEQLYMEGQLMISRTKTFQKRYDLPLNLTPQETDQNIPTKDEFAKYVIRRTLGALGIASVKEMSWRARRVKGNLVKEEVEKMVSAGEIYTVVVEGYKGAPLYMLTEQQIDIKLAHDVFILSPFDIFNVFRHRLKDFFSFDYQIECFVPAAKRKYGYFSLPVLAGDTFIARIDAKADRKQKLLIVHNLHFESLDLDQGTIEKLIEALKSYVLFNQCRDIIFKKSNNEIFLEAIRKGLLE